MDEDQVTSSSIEFSKKSDECSLLIKPQEKGLSWGVATLFVLGQVLGGGVVAIGDGLASTGWWGILIMIFGLFVNIFASRILSDTVVGVAKSVSREPFSGTVGAVLGSKVKALTTTLFFIYSVSTCTVYLLLTTDLTLLFLGEFFPELKQGYQLRIWLCVVALVLLPIMWLGTPKDFWLMALLAVLTTTLAAIFFLINLWLARGNEINDITPRDVTATSFFYGMGTIFFAFSGVPFFPNIQNDMRDCNEFKKSSTVGYVIIFFVYAPVAISGNYLLRSKIDSNIIFNAIDEANYHSEPLKKYLKALAFSALFLLAGHFLCAYNLIFNGISQEFEERLQINTAFNWRRCLLRTLLVALTLVLAQVVPKFDIILSFCGGTILMVLSYHIPSAAYLKHHSSCGPLVKLAIAGVCSMGVVTAVGSVYANAMLLVSFYKQ